MKNLIAGIRVYWQNGKRWGFYNNAEILAEIAFGILLGSVYETGKKHRGKA